MPPEVQVELYVQGKGPVHVFKTALQGWDQNRLDLESIMRTYKLKAIYAFSVTSGRGNRLLYDPRNGLSRLAYSGKPNALIRLDGDPPEPFFWLVAKVVFGFVLIGGLAFLTLSDLFPDFRTYSLVLTCFVTMLYSQLVWRPMKKYRFMTYGQMPDHLFRSQPNEELLEVGSKEDKKAV